MICILHLVTVLRKGEFCSNPYAKGGILQSATLFFALLLYHAKVTQSFSRVKTCGIVHLFSYSLQPELIGAAISYFGPEGILK
jgi:hypothetical protein